MTSVIPQKPPFSVGIASAFKGLIAALFCAGLVARLMPLFDQDRRLFWYFMTEDGYLMQTVARNMAIGNGMSTADGTMATNGVQPLATFFFAALHALAGGSKVAAVFYVTVASVLVAALSAWMLWNMGLKIFERELPAARQVALTASAVWFASPLVIAHGMNGLETGIYYLALIGAVSYYFSIDLNNEHGMRPAQRIVFGGILGVAFLARNDAVLFIATILLVHLFSGGPAGGGVAKRFGDTIAIGLVSMLVAAPWLIYNYMNYGSIVPISGTAQSHSAEFAGNLSIIPANLVEALLLYLPIPRQYESNAIVVLGSVILLLGVAALIGRFVSRSGLRGNRFTFLVGGFGLSLAGYYGLFFGAPHFITRYMSSMTPLLAVLMAALFYQLLLLRRQRVFIGDTLMVGLLASALLITGARSMSHVQEDPNNGHRQVVDWVSQNVLPSQWVAAVQTGTLGFFHDKTINLDGKVNPDALRVLRDTADIRPYVVRQSSIAFLVDWVGISDWVSQPNASDFSETFEVLVADHTINLGVLRRRPAGGESQPPG